MSDLFDSKGAIWGDGRQYRYALWRTWDDALPKVMFIGLNPSTANEHKNDQTITNVIKLAKNNGFGAVYMLNLFGVVSSDPRILKTHSNPIGDNDRYLKWISERCLMVVYAWGAFKVAEERAKEVMAMFPGAYCIGKNNNGTPWHPLFKKSTTKFIKF